MFIGDRQLLYVCTVCTAVYSYVSSDWVCILNSFGEFIILDNPQHLHSPQLDRFPEFRLQSEPYLVSSKSMSFLQERNMFVMAYREGTALL